jgi:adenylylsulfate kinase-like enzyme
MIYYLIGQPGAGKTTIAEEMITNPKYDTFAAFHIDGDDIRELFDNKDYSETGRRKNIELAQKIAQYLHNKNEDVVISLVSPYKDLRDQFKKKMGDNILEVYIHTNEIRGRESYFVENYEPPTDDYFNMCTDNVDVKTCVEVILRHEKLL